MIYIKTLFDLSIDDDESPSVRERIPTIDWNTYDTLIDASINSGQQILRVNSIIGNDTWLFMCWNTMENYEQFLIDTKRDQIISLLSSVGIEYTREVLEGWSIDDVISDIQTISGDNRILWWAVPEPYKHLEMPRT